MAFVKYFAKKVDETVTTPKEKCRLCKDGIVNPETRICDKCGQYVPKIYRKPTPKPLLKVCPHCYYVLPETEICDNCGEKITNPIFVKSIL